MGAAFFVGAVYASLLASLLGHCLIRLLEVELQFARIDENRMRYPRKIMLLFDCILMWSESWVGGNHKCGK